MNTAANSYELLIVMALCVALAPALAITVILRPRPWTSIFRGGEVVAWLALALEMIRRLDAIATTPTLPYPGDGDAFRQLAYLAAICMFAWIRFSQHMRHRVRNDRTRDLFQQHVEPRDGAG